ncbi:NADH-quinone oxidoreductase subunit NuoE [Frankia sp. CcWB3]
MAFSPETQSAAQEIIARYPAGRSRSALLPLLHLVQAEQGCVTAQGVAFCADVLGITRAEVGAVATFYTMYKRHPVGDYLVSVCTNLSCALLGGEDVYERVSKLLGIGHDETTPDGSITLEHAECLAACDYAPVMTVNYEFYDQVDPDSAQAIVEDLRAGRRPAPARGGPLCSFAEVSRQLAGFGDPRPEGVAGPGVGEPSVVGLLVAEAAGWSAEQAPAPLVTHGVGADAAARPASPPAGPPPAVVPAPTTPASSERKGS